MTDPLENDARRTLELLRHAKTAALTAEQQNQLELAKSDRTGKQAWIMVADDSEAVRTIIILMLRSLGYRNLSEAVDGQDAIEQLQKKEHDLLVLDIEMPRMDGYKVLETVKGDPVLRHMPVIVASGLNELEAIVRCIELGAEDFLPKPVNSVIMRARVAASLERKRLRDLEQLRLIELHWEKQLLAFEQEKSERLLLNILPPAIAERLKQGEQTIAERYADVSVLFADLVDFTTLVQNTTDPVELVGMLNDLFSRFDEVARTMGLEKIKTIGDCYLVVGGLPLPREDHPEAVATMALAMLDTLAAFNQERGMNLSLRLGMHVGPVVAGVIGHQKFAYDLWGATVNLASRLQTSGTPNRVLVSGEAGDRLRDKFRIVERGAIMCKGIGKVRTCFIDGKI
ncbi:MAG TPA: adenylate/guanylate cyclase domain-containing protein [Opitutaceae bacterium]|nr:adenylate/guanylate cyclase domain-containing protein [Opitutaceae bacterium]HND61330.1 adenylate/guanylate cyclase domain-containing protein [Opitutaceae bacterium]